MTKTYTAPFAQTPKTATAVVTAALGGLGTDIPTGTVQLLQAGADGAIVTRLSAMPRAQPLANSLVLYLATSADNYATQRLIDSETMAAQTFSTGARIDEISFANYSETTPLRLAASDRLYVGAQVTLAAGIVFKAEYTDF